MACLTATAALLLALPFVEGDAGCDDDPARGRGLLQVGMKSDTFLTDSDWFLGATGQSCSDVCGAAGKFCHESSMFDVDTKEEMLAVARKVGYNCTKLYGWAYDNNPGICVDSSCCGGNCIGLCAFGTTKVRTCNGTSHYARLCECFVHAETTSTTTQAVLSPPKAKPPGFARSLFLLPHDVELMLLLATIPAASKTAGEPALLVMPQSGNDETAFLDFVEQYRPEETYASGSLSLGSLEATLGDVKVVGGGTPCQASETLARKFWYQASELVVARCDDYPSALMAAPLAAKKSSPLVLLSHTVDLVNLAAELKVQSLVFVGSGSGPEAPGLPQIHLQTAEDVFDALGKPDYLAVTNPADRELQAYRATSALAPLLAALRGGAVLPLSAGARDSASVSASEVKEEIQQFVFSKGMPKHLALVGGPTAIPPHCQTGRLFNEEKCRDAPYADLDEDIFMDVALGRVVGRDLSSTSLLVSRISNYEYIRDPESETKFAVSGHLKTAMANIQPALRNVGFEEPVSIGFKELHNLKKIHVSAFLHTDHSGAGGMGNSFDFSSQNLLSPMMVSSGGCSTAGLDELSDPMHSVVLTMLHYGAIGFVGGPRNAITASGLVHSALWNGIAEGKSIGEAFLEGWNDVAVNYKDQDGYVLAEYVMMNIALYGDPAFKLFVPTSPQEPLPKVILDGDTAEVTGPGHWTKFKADEHVTDEWGWDGDLYYYGAVGALVQRQWVVRYDREWPYYYVRIKTDKFVHDVLPVTPVPAGLGYVGASMSLRGEFSGSAGNKWHLDEHADGTRTLMWRVRLLDYSYETGIINSQFHSQRYKISFSDIPLSDTTTTTTQTLPDPTSICEKQCEEDGFCCGWNSGCGRPSCVLGCHIATESADVTVCQETCRSLHDGQGCFPTVAGRWANVCSSCQGSCSGHCEGEGGCEHACSLMAYATTTTTTVVLLNWEIARCRMKCASDGYCCDRDSGCAAPSCKLGCEVASVSPSAVTCKERCQALTGHCFVDPVNNSLGDVNLCASCSTTCGGHCEAAGGCEHACDFVSY